MYKIKPKRDFGSRGFLINGRWVTKGFVVTDGFSNIMPGATWFETVEDAMKALYVYCSVWGNGDAFWNEMKATK